jgi:hypothetical protein
MKLNCPLLGMQQGLLPLPRVEITLKIRADHPVTMFIFLNWLLVWITFFVCFGFGMSNCTLFISGTNTHFPNVVHDCLFRLTLLWILCWTQSLLVPSADLAMDTVTVVYDGKFDLSNAHSINLSQNVWTLVTAAHFVSRLCAIDLYRNVFQTYFTMAILLSGLVRNNR